MNLFSLNDASHRTYQKRYSLINTYNKNCRNMSLKFLISSIFSFIVANVIFALGNSGPRWDRCYLLWVWTPNCLVSKGYRCVAMVEFIDDDKLSVH